MERVREIAYKRPSEDSCAVGTAEKMVQFSRPYVHKLFESLHKNFSNCVRLQQEACKKVNEAHLERDLKTLRRMDIVGMTTTRAAMNSELVQKLSPLCSDRAEILEPQLLACLSESVRQLIIIGDHQQLSPSCYRHFLETKKNLGVSLN